MRRFRRLPVVLSGLVSGLLLVGPVGAAHAGKANPWSAYTPAKGVTCTSTTSHADGTTETLSTTVLTKTARRIVTRTTGQGRTTALLLPGGRLHESLAFTQRDSGVRMHVVLTADYPSPAKLLHHRSGSQTMTMTMTLPARIAKSVLVRGRTLTLTGRYRVTGLGARTVTLADAAGTTVDALGIRTTMRSFTMRNATPRFARAIRKDMRSVFASLAGSEWVAKGRGTVRAESTDPDGAVVTTQVGCH